MVALWRQKKTTLSNFVQILLQAVCSVGKGSGTITAV